MRCTRAITVFAVAATVASLATACVPRGGPGRGPLRLIDCSHAAERNVVEVSSKLDPSCTYTGGFDITRSNVVLDCRGASVSAPGAGGVGILVQTPVDVSMRDVTVRNCHVEGFLNSFRATRVGFHDLEPGHEYDHELSGVVLEHSTLSNSRGVDRKSTRLNSSHSSISYAVFC